MGELMKLFFGTKLVSAKPMTLGQYNAYRGWDMPANEDPARAGYLVEYLGAGDKNHQFHDNYISWSPAITFDNSHVQVAQHHGAVDLPLPVQRLMAETVDLHARLTELHASYGTEEYEALSIEEKADIVVQDTLMSKLVDVMARRVQRVTAQESIFDTDG